MTLCGMKDLYDNGLFDIVDVDNAINYKSNNINYVLQYLKDVSQIIS